MSLSLVTGATGLVGYSIAKALRDEDRHVRLLARNPESAAAVVLTGCEIVQGDVTDRESIDRAIAGCDVVYHAAGIPEQWLVNPQTFNDVNVGGTRNMIAAAQQAEVRKFVYTSTQDVFHAEPNQSFDESRLATSPMPSAYQQSKLDADVLVSEAIDNGLDAVFLHPVAVYGPGPSQSRGMNQFFMDLIAGDMPVLLAGAMPIVFSTDLGRGHVLAEAAASGSRYLLSDRLYSLKEIAEAVSRVVSGVNVPPVMPAGVASLISVAGEMLSKFTQKPPLIPKGQLHGLLNAGKPDHAKAARELKWEPRSLLEGLPETLEYLQT